MGCYGDVVSLKETIARLLKSSKLNAESRNIIEFYASGMVKSVHELLHHHDVSCGLVDDSTSMWEERAKLNEVLKRGGAGQRSSSSIRRIGQRMNGLDAKIRDAARELEDALETHLLDHHHQLDRLQQEEKLKQDIFSFNRQVMELKEEYAKADEAAAEEEEYKQDWASREKKMVGYSDVLGKMKDWLVFDSIVVLVGMAGIGKTTLARRFFDDSQVSQEYDHCVWVTVGPKYQFIDILKSIMNQLDPTGGYTLTEEDALVSQFYKTVENLMCVIVLDDVWNNETIQPLRELVNAEARRHTFGCCMILVTSRLEKIGAGATTYPRNNKMIKLRFMNEDESWDLLRDKVFGEDDTKCTPELVKAGKKIAENCEGLPLTIVTVADILMSKAHETMTPEYWNQVAEGRNSVFVDAYQQMSEVLLRSYEFLPRYSKEHFLYLGVFPQKYNIPLSKLALLWGAEGCFLLEAPKSFDDLQDHVSRHMEELIGKSLVLVRKTAFKNKPKTYGLHSAYWHSCVGVAAKNKFFHVFNKYADILEAQRMRNQRRLCIHNNVLFAIKDVHNSMASISSARSFLCTGPHHQYPVPVCFERLRLLRVIDALTVRFYEFPAQVVELVLLRYLALTCDAGKIPTLISKLSNLEILIVHRYLNIVKLHKKDESSYLPMEIWDMKELKHLQVMGGDLPEPRAGVFLPNLMTLLDANASSCTKGVLKGLPKLKKLGIRIELSADDDEPLCISYHNTSLESIKCVVVNPVFRWSPIVSSLLFPNSLKKLSLNGLGCPWEDINEALASLPSLCVLKLRCYAFRGAKWETPKKGFRSLKFLLIEDTDLVHWTAGNRSFLKLKCLVLKQCYKLQQIEPWFVLVLNRIELVDCSPSVVACTKFMQLENRKLEVFVDSSWDDDGKKLKS